MTPPAVLAVLAACPSHLLLRDPNPLQQGKRARGLAEWLLARGYRPSLLELELERARRASASAT